MNNTQIIAERIKLESQRRGLNVKDVLISCQIKDRNLVNKLANGNDTSTQNVYKLAEFFGISIDYLLGRIDIPEVSGSTNVTNNEQNNINGNNNISVNAAVPDKKDDLTEQFLQIFQQLNFEDKVSVMQYVKDIKKSPLSNGDKK